MKSWQLIILQNVVSFARLHLATHCVREVTMKWFFSAAPATLPAGRQVCVELTQAK